MAAPDPREAGRQGSTQTAASAAGFRTSGRASFGVWTLASAFGPRGWCPGPGAGVRAPVSASGHPGHPAALRPGCPPPGAPGAHASVFGLRGAGRPPPEPPDPSGCPPSGCPPLGPRVVRVSIAGFVRGRPGDGTVRYAIGIEWCNRDSAGRTIARFGPYAVSNRAIATRTAANPAKGTSRAASDAWVPVCPGAPRLARTLPGVDAVSTFARLTDGSAPARGRTHPAHGGPPVPPRSTGLNAGRRPARRAPASTGGPSVAGGAHVNGGAHATCRVRCRTRSPPPMPSARATLSAPPCSHDAARTPPFSPRA